MFDLETIKFAFTNLKRQRLRSYLTLLGMVIGIAAIVALFTMSNGLSIAVEEMFEGLGLDTLTVQPGQQLGLSQAVSRSIENEDIDIINNIAGVEAVAGFYEGAAIAEYRDRELSAFLIGYDPAQTEFIQQMGYLSLDSGRLLESSDLYSIMISKSFAETALEDKELSLRQKIEINGMNFRIVGLLKDSDMATSFGINNLFWVTKNAAQDLFDIEEPIELMVKVTDESLAEPVAEEIAERLERAHGEKDVTVLTTGSLLESFNSILGLMQAVLIMLAFISVIVGAIGIMNTMLMAVLDRTREIGAMKAIGATNSTILSIFITEAALLGLAGGSAGVVLGYIVALGISGVAASVNFNLPIVADLSVILFGISVSVVVGIVSGIFPARRAALMDPVEALRFE